MSYVLVIFSLVNGGWSPAAVDMQNRTTCETAIEKIYAAVKEADSGQGGNSRRPYVWAVCLPK